MNNAQANRFMVAFQTATASSGMKRIDLDITKNRGVYSNDRYPEKWPCNKNHPHNRIITRQTKTGTRLYCRECELERAQKKRNI